MNLLVPLLAVLAQDVKRDVPYAEPALERQVLDIHAPAGAKDLPVVFWIHGGGWQAGDKSMVQEKPAFFTGKGYVFVAPNYRLLPKVEMEVIFKDVAKALGWVRRNIAAHGGDPDRILVMGHSAGAQLAALLCIDERWLKAEGVPFSALKGCVPVDGDTFDVPSIIEVAEVRARAHGEPLPVNGHRQKFGNDPRKHVDYSAVTHVAKGKGIPPFLIIHVAEHPDTSVQARRLARVLKGAEIPVTLHGGRDTTHSRINDTLGVAGDPGTKALSDFLAAALR